MTGYTLPQGYKLGAYTVQEVLGEGGFGITYLATHRAAGWKAAIKEYFPTELAIRDAGATIRGKTGKKGEHFEWGLGQFVEEANRLAQFEKNPNIVSVRDIISQNNTAYIVMEFVEGCSLDRRMEAGESFSAERTLNITCQICEALTALHAKDIIHRDIAPDNIILSEDDTVTLIDFGAARQIIAGASQSLSVVIKQGYAPKEQYSRNAPQGPWNDVYALSATLYHLITGDLPVEATERSEEEIDPLVPIENRVDQALWPEGFLAAIDRGLALKSKERPQSIADWWRYVEGEAKEERAAAPTVASGADPHSETLRETKTKRANWVIVLVGLAVLAAFTYGASTFWLNNTDEVQEAQKLLRVLEYQVPTSGELEIRTQDAIRTFERSKAMTETGFVDDILLQALRQAVADMDDAAFAKAERAVADLRTDLSLSDRLKALADYRRAWPNGRHVDQADDLAWQLVSQENTEEAYDLYAEEFPDGRHVSKVAAAKQALLDAREAARQRQLELERYDEKAWQTAQQQDSIVGYQTYEEELCSDGHYQTFGGQYCDQATTRRMELERIARDEADWAVAERSNTIAGYSRYERAHPRGIYVEESRRRRTVLEEEDSYWQETLSANSIERFLAYEARYENGRYREESRRLRLELEKQQREAREEALYKTAKDTLTVEAFQDYLTEFPGGKYAAVAQKMTGLVADMRAYETKTKNDFEQFKTWVEQNARTPYATSTREGCVRRAYTYQLESMDLTWWEDTQAPYCSIRVTTREVKHNYGTPRNGSCPTSYYEDVESRNTERMNFRFDNKISEPIAKSLFDNDFWRLSGTDIGTRDRWTLKSHIDQLNTNCKSAWDRVVNIRQQLP